MLFGQVAVAGVDADGFVAVEVLDVDGAAFDFDQGAVAAVGGVPDRAADGAGGVASAGAEAAFAGGVQRLEDAFGYGCVRAWLVAGLAGGARLIGGAAGEGVLEHGERREPFGRSILGLAC